MRRIPIIALVLLVLVLSGWFAIERGWFDGARVVPPPGGDALGIAIELSPEVAEPGGPALAQDPLHGRESAATDHARGSTTALLLVRVTDLASGKVVEGATIALHAFGSADAPGETADPSGVLLNPAEETDAHTDGRGEALIEVPSAVLMSLRVRDRGPEIGRSDHSIPALEPGERREVLVALPRGVERDHWVRAVGGSPEKPIAGASVRLVFAGTPLPSSEAATAEPSEPTVLTDSEGLAPLRVPSWKTALTRIDAIGFGPRIAAVVPGHDAQARAQVVPLTRAASLTATLTASPGIPMAGGTLVLIAPASEIAIPRGTTVLTGNVHWSAVTDEAGTCRIVDLPAEVPLRVEVRRGADVLHRLADSWTFSPGEKAERSVCLSGAARLFGVLLGPESRPVAGAEIWLARVPGTSDSATADPHSEQEASRDRYFWTGTLEQPFATARTDEQGGFSFEGVEWGEWWVGPAPVRASQGDETADAIAPRAQVVRVHSDSTEVEVVLRATAARWIHGKVVDPNDVAVAQTVVRARAVDALGFPTTRTAPDGTFALGPLAEGSFALRAQGRWGWTDSAETTARAGDRDVLLRLAPGATLRGRAVDRDTGAGCVATVYLSQPGSQGESGTSESRGDEPRAAIASAGRDGSFEFRGLVPGTYDVLGRSSDGRVGFLSDVIVRLGESASQTVVILAPGGKLRVRNDGAQGWGRYAILSQGKTLAGGSVKAGSSVLVSVPAGSLTVRFSSNGKAPEERQVEVSAGDAETEAAFSSD